MMINTNIWVEAMKRTLDQLKGEKSEQEVAVSNVGVQVAESVSVDEMLQDLDVGYPVLTLPMKSPMVLRTFLTQNQSIVSDFTLRMISMAITRKLDHVIMFRCGESDYLAIFTEDQYCDQLSEISDYYLRTEQYEKVARCQKLIKKYNIERLITESQSL